MQAALPAYDVAVIGGGLAGLSAAIQLARGGSSVVLLEKQAYPFHKVCGEYLSMESWGYLESIGLRLSALNPPRIDDLFFSAPSGKFIRHQLPLGGFGISRYRLDAEMANLALRAGVHLRQQCKVLQAAPGNPWRITYASRGAGQEEVRAQVCLGAFGKHSNLERSWRTGLKSFPSFGHVAVKYHVYASQEKSTIGLHNFPGGYCGISAIEDEKFCLCYLIQAQQLKKQNGNLVLVEQNILSANPHLKKIFSEAEKLRGFPITISQINFATKPLSRQGMLMIGDAAGMIAPLGGNGMSIALHSGKLAANFARECLKGRLSVQQMGAAYDHCWRCHFGTRFWAGRQLQHFFGHERRTEILLAVFRWMPFLQSPVIRLTHGRSF